jgi:hypothetical protein
VNNHQNLEGNHDREQGNGRGKMSPRQKKLRRITQGKLLDAVLHYSLHQKNNELSIL